MIILKDHEILFQKKLKMKTSTKIICSNTLKHLKNNLKIIKCFQTQTQPKTDLIVSVKIKRFQLTKIMKELNFQTAKLNFLTATNGKNFLCQQIKFPWTSKMSPKKV
jgi:hypothetical protein